MNKPPASTSTPSDCCELLIVGAGPAGMAAALAAAASGARITLIDDNPAPGGQIWRDGPAAHLPPQALRQRDALYRMSWASHGDHTTDLIGRESRPWASVRHAPCQPTAEPPTLADRFPNTGPTRGLLLP